MICIPGCGEVHGSAVSCEQAEITRNKDKPYEAVAATDHYTPPQWYVRRGDAFVAGRWTDPAIAEDYAAMLNHARELRQRAAAGPQGPPSEPSLTPEERAASAVTKMTRAVCDDSAQIAAIVAAVIREAVDAETTRW